MDLNRHQGLIHSVGGSKKPIDRLYTDQANIQLYTNHNQAI